LRVDALARLASEGHTSAETERSSHRQHIEDSQAGTTDAPEGRVSRAPHSPNVQQAKMPLADLAAGLQLLPFVRIRALDYRVEAFEGLCWIDPHWATLSGPVDRANAC
jgi:hypothetical protein